MRITTYRKFYLVPRYFGTDRGFTIKWLGLVFHYRNSRF